MDGNYAIPRIVLFMGASSVEAVADVKQASKRSLNDYDYVLVKDSPPLPLVEGAKYIDMEWLKNCLIANRIFELPQWSN